MEIEDLQPLAAAVELQRRVLAAAADPALRQRQVDVPLADDGKTAQGGVAVAPLLQADIVAEGEMRVAGASGQLCGEIELPRAGCSLVDLLEHHHVRFIVTQDLDDTLRPKPAVDADGAVDVVGDDS